MTRGEIIMRSAELRLVNALDAFRRGNSAHDEAEHQDQLREIGWADPGPTTHIRRKLMPNWGWWKRIRGR